MAELPSGTVTFMLTDVEGSTALWEEAPEAMRSALVRHDALYESAVHEHGGVHIRPRGEGDSRFAVFASASAAVRSAVAIQRTFAAERWPTPRPIKVRIGLHSGEADLRDGDYYGSAVNRCARLRDVAHGGQVLVSQAACDLIRNALPEDVDLRDMGEHRLRDLIHPERLYQVMTADLPTDFPALRYVQARLTNLPVPPTTFIGRERELAEISDLLVQDDVRLLTLAGPGGIGKTRLAVEAARRLIDREQLTVAFVELAPIADLGLVPHAIASAVGVRERADRPLIATVTDALRAVRLLLVLDNCEHLATACGSAAQTLRAACPELRVLATSRAALGVSGETVWSVPLLPTGIGDAARPESPQLGEAVQLFVERARLRVTGFRLNAENVQVVAEICRRLEGLPLAIELAAARVALLPPVAMLSRLDRQLPLLVGGPRDAPARHQTLRATIGWSYDLLSDHERAVFRQLGIFAGGFSLEAAEAICTAGADVAPASPDASDVSARQTSRAAPPITSLLDILESLLAQNLLRQERTLDVPRLTMLESIREFARDQLEASGQVGAVRERYASYFLALAEEAGNQLLGRDQLAWLARLDTELDHIRAVFGWCRDREISTEIGLRLAGALGMYWEYRGLAIEGHDWMMAMLSLPDASARTVGRARALYSAGFVAAMRGDFATQRALAQESATIFRETGQLLEVGRALAEQAIAEARLENLAESRALLERSVAIAREHGDQWALSFALGQLGHVAYGEGDFAAARGFREAAAEVARAHNDRHTLGLALAGLALVARRQGRYEESSELFQETLRVSSELRDQWIMPRAIGGLAGAAVLAADHVRAARLFGATETMRETSGIREAAQTFRELYEQDAAEARAALGVETFAAQWAEGRAMSQELAVEYALEASVSRR
ncbi:MAG: adenylate/guanylate cyclase domain-containing protein [Chloroflexi bacterium]|nr:adenylate/guanylate cyclase domain-containing protein [Chloroflexota bacterium]